MSPPDPAPTRAAYRKAEVVKADLLHATVELLAERPAGQVTVRAIAERAGVQHSMVARHFGSKAELIAAAVESVASRYATVVASASDPAEGFVLGLQHLRDSPTTALVLAAPAAVRGGGDEHERFPGFAAHLRAMLDAGQPDDERTKVLAGLSISLVIAWSAMRDIAVDAAGLDRDDLDLVDELAAEMLAGMVRSQLRDDSSGA
jgi:AcrR family transcriptional regulator